MLTRGPMALAIADITTCKPEEGKNSINFQYFCRVEPYLHYNELKKMSKIFEYLSNLSW